MASIVALRMIKALVRLGWSVGCALHWTRTSDRCRAATTSQQTRYPAQCSRPADRQPRRDVHWREPRSRLSFTAFFQTDGIVGVLRSPSPFGSAVNPLRNCASTQLGRPGLDLRRKRAVELGEVL